MNKIFKTISNCKNGLRVTAVASELAKGSGSTSASSNGSISVAVQPTQWFKLRQLTAFLITGILGVNAWALPTGGKVVNGSATITSTGSAMTVQQAAGNATINWSRFNVGTGESVTFKLANPNNITLNRVGGDSVVNGTVTSNGNLWFATGGNLFTVGSNGAISAMKEVFITSQDMAVGQYTKPTGAASSGAINVLPAGKLAARLIHIDAGSVNMSRAELIANSLDDAPGGITIIGQRLAVNDSTLGAGNGNIVIGREGWGVGALAQTTDVSGSTLTAKNVETSADVLTTSGVVVKASHWLLDPTTVTITASNTTGGVAPTGSNYGANLSAGTGQAVASNISTTDIQNSINAGTSVTIFATQSISQTGDLVFSVTPTNATPTLTYTTISGEKGKIEIGGAITDNTSASGSNVSLVAISSGGAIGLYQKNVSLKGSLTFDNTYEKNGASGFITHLNALNTYSSGKTYALNSGDPITFGSGGGGLYINGVHIGTSVVTAGTGITLKGVVASSKSGYLNAAVDIVGSTLNVTSGDITLNGWYLNNVNPAAGHGLSGVRLSGNSNLTATNGNINITAYGRNTVGNSTSQGLNQNAVVSLANGTSTANQINIYGDPLDTKNTGQGVLNTGHDFVINNNTTTQTLYANGGVALNIYGAYYYQGPVSVFGTPSGINMSGGTITNNVAGGDIVLTSNYSIVNTSAISLQPNTTAAPQYVTYDVTTGTKNAVITTGPLTVAAGASTQPINFSVLTAGAPITIGSAIDLPGYIRLDNTFGGTAGAGGTTTSGHINAANASTLATASTGITVNATLKSGALANAYGTTIKGVSSSGQAVVVNATGDMTSNASGITITGDSNTGTTVMTLSGDLTTNNSGSLTVEANGGTVGNGIGITSSGAINQNVNGGSITFASNNDISQSGAITLAANTSGSPSAVTYDTTSGNRTTTITSGALTLTGGVGASTSGINYLQKTAGAAISIAGRALPGYILLDNTYGAASGTPVSGYITASNASTLATASNGITVSGALTSGGFAGVNGITINGVSTGTYAVTASADMTANAGSILISGVAAGASGTGVYLNNVDITASGGTYTAGNTNASDSIRITGTALSGQAAINVAGATTITNNSTFGNTSLVANVGNYAGPVRVTNASTAGAIQVSAIGTNSAIASTAVTAVVGSGSLYTQNSNSGIYMATSNNGNLTAPKIANNGTGDVVLAAGAYLPVGTATGGQIIGVSGNTLTSANGNVYLYSGAPTNAASSTTATSTTQLGYLVSSLSNLSFNNTVFSQAYADTNIAATSLPNTGINISNLPSANTKTGSTAGPAIQFRVQPSYQMVLGGNLTKVYGTADPANTLNSVGTPGTLQNVLSQNFATPATNPTRLRTNAGVTEIILSVNGTNFYIPLSNFLNSITGTRTGYGVLAGEQAYTMPTSGTYNANYGYNFASSMGILVTSGVLVSSVVGTNPVGLSITKAPLTITSYGTNFTYDGVTKFDGLVSISGLVASVNGVSTGDAVSSVTNTFRTGAVLGAGTVITNPATTVVNAGTYNGQPSAAVGTGLSNYNITYTGASFTVAPAPLSVDGSSTSRVYIGAAQTNGPATITGLKGADSITVTGYGTGTNVVGGPYADNLNVNWGTALASNYTLTTTNGALTITTAPLTISASPVTTTYGTAQTLSASSGVTTTGLLSNADSVSGVGFTYNGTSTVPGTLSAGTYTNALVTANATGTNLSNYTISYGTADLVVNKANLTITQPAQTLTYNGTLRGGTAASSLGTVSGNTVSTGINGDAFTVTGTASGTNVGSYTSSLLASGGNASNYNIAYTNGTLTINPATLTITAASTTKVYDGTITSSGTPTISGLFELDSVTGVTQAYGSKNVLGAGNSTLSVNATGYTVNDGNGGANYTVVRQTATGTITPRPLTVSGIAAADKVYDGTNTANVTASGAQVSGAIAGDAVTASIGSVTGTFADVNVGASKAINLAGISLSGGDAGNYTLAGAAGVSAAITPRPLVITGATTSSTYTAGTQTNLYTVAGDGTAASGVVAGQSITATGSGTSRNVGTSADTLVAVAGSGTALSNYSISYVNGGLTITPYQLNPGGTPSASNPGLTVVANNRVYDGSTTASGALTPVLFAGDQLTATASSASFDTKNAGTGKTVTFAGITLSGDPTTLANYTLGNTTTATATANIAPAPLSVTGANQSATYSAGTQANTATVSGLVQGEALNITGYGSGSNAGTYADALVVTAGANTSLSNYVLTTSNGALTITPYQLNFGANSTGARVVATANDKVYNANTAATGSVNVLDLLGSDVLTASSSSATFDTKDAGTNKTVTFGGITLAGNATTLSNYTMGNTSSVTATANITPAPLSVTGANQSATYSSGTQANTATVSGLVQGEALNITGYGSGSNAGTYADALVVTAGANTSLSNYVLTTSNGALTITPYQLNPGGTPSANNPGVAVVANNRVYDGSTTATGTLTPVLFAGDTLTAAASGASFDTKNAGTGKTVTFGGITLSGDATTLANYTLGNTTTATATANITPYQLNPGGTPSANNPGVAVVANNRVYDGSTTATGTLTPVLFAGDTLTAAASGASFDTKNAGTGKTVTFGGITLSGDATTLANYTLGNTTTATATANIAPAPLSVTGANQSATYSAGAQANTATVSGLVQGEALNITGYGSGSNAGTYADALVVTAGANTSLSNYVLTTSNGALTITPYQLNFGANSTGARIVGTANDKVYNANTAATGSVNVLDLLGSDVLTASSSSATFDTKDAGTNKTVTFGGITLAGNATTLSNYTMGNTSSVTATANITPAPLSVTGANQSATYSSGTQANTATVSGLVQGEALNITGYGSGSNAGTYADALVVTAGANTSLSNYVLTTSNGALTITPYQLNFGANSTGARIVGTANDKVYNANTAATGSVNVLDLLGSDVLTASSSSATFDTKDAGTNKTVTFGGITLAGNATTLSNYTMGNTSSVTATANITPAPLSVTGANQSATYSSGTQANTATVSGLVQGEALNITGYGSGSNAGTYADALVVTAGANTSLSNYVLTTSNGALTITPYQLNPGGTPSANNPGVAVVANNRVYDGSTTATGTLTPVLFAGDTLTAAASGASFDTKNAGTGKTVTFGGITLSGDATTLANYTLGNTTTATATANITPYQLNPGGTPSANNPGVAVVANNRVYDGSTTATGTLTPVLFAGDTLTAAASGASFDTKNAGTGKTVTFGGITLSGDATTLANYTLGNTTTATATANIAPAPLSVTGANQSATYSAGAQANTATVSGLVQGEALNITGYGSGSNAGTYADALVVTAGANTSLSNYVLTTSNGALTITPYQLNFGANSTGARIVGTANDKVYNANTAATGSVNVLDLLGSDVLTASSSSATFDTKNAGTGKTVTFGGITLAGNATTLSNYTMGNTSSVTTTANITPAPATVTAIAATRVFSGLTQNQEVTISGYLDGGDAISGMGVSGQVIETNAGSYQSKLVVSNNNYNVTAVDAPFVILSSPPYLLPVPVQPTNAGGVSPVSIDSGIPSAPPAGPAVGGGSGVSPAAIGGGTTPATERAAGGSTSASPAASGGSSGASPAVSGGSATPSASGAGAATSAEPVAAVSASTSPAGIGSGSGTSPAASGGVNPSASGGGATPAAESAAGSSLSASLPANGSGSASANASSSEPASASGITSNGSTGALSGQGNVGSQVNNNVRNYDLTGFSSGSEVLTKDFKDLLDTLSERKVVITGYADKEEANPTGVSLRRAELVRDHLISKGWSPSNISIEAHGATDQFDKQNPGSNRRTDIRGDWPLN